MLVEENTFKDWIEDARQHAAADEEAVSKTPHVAPHLSLPDTPTPNVEIRLVEPTPVPSRVGSLGNGSLNGGNLLSKSAMASSRPEPPVCEEAEEEATTSKAAPQETDSIPVQSRRRGNRFFLYGGDKASAGSDTSQVSQASQVSPNTTPAPPAEEPTASSPTTSSNWRSSGSGDSSSVVVIKKKERRHVSLATMSGRFQREKRIAAQAIAAKTAEEGKDDDDDEWEDDDEEGSDEDTLNEEEGDSPNEQGSNGDGNDDDDGDWEDESPEQSVKPAPPPPPPPVKSKKERAAERARVEAEKAEQEQQRKRAMFAKMQIDAVKPPSSEGLLTRTFRSGKSLVDLTQAGQDDRPDVLRRAPTHAQFTTLSQSPMQMNAPSGLLRSKSAVAMPVQSGVSVMSRKSADSQRSGTSDDRRPPVPDEVEMESSDEDSEDDTYLASSQVQRKLDVLAAKRDARRQGSTQMPVPVPPAAAAPNGDFDENGIVRPISPTSRRRMIIMREMSESLRRSEQLSIVPQLTSDIILEREKSSGGTKPYAHTRPPPSVHTSRLPTVASGHNLAGMNPPAPHHRHSAGDVHNDHHAQLGRHSSHPNLSGYQETSPTSPDPQRASISPNEAMRRRSQVLGSGLLRPLTRADEPRLNRTRSAAALNSVESSPTQRAPSSPLMRATALQAPPMVRSSTEGDQEERERQRKRELLRRSEATDTGYRWHGW